MTRNPVRAEWFKDLKTVNLSGNLLWLAPLRNSVNAIANFGCWKSSEPFGLLWSLDASEIVVIEKDKAHLDWPREELDKLSKTFPDSIESRSISFVVADMSDPIPELEPDRFDLAYCQNVLYSMEGEPARLRSSIGQMARVVKPPGWIVAVEPKLLRPKGVRDAFENLGLEPVQISQAPESAFCFRKQKA